jgi:hypothetical protein
VTNPRRQRRNARHSARAGKRLEKTYRYFSATGDGLPGVSEVLGILALDVEAKESLGQVVEMPGYIRPLYFTRAAICGNAVHTAIEATMQGNPVAPMVVAGTAAMSLHNANARGEMDPQDIQEQANKAAHAFENWLRSEWPKVRPFTVEERIVDEELRVGMTADLVVEDGEALRVIDWKTTSCATRGSLKPSLEARYRLQLGAYAGLVGRKYGRKVSGATLVFCPKHQGRDVFEVSMDREELGRQWRTFEHVLAAYHALRGER